VSSSRVFGPLSVRETCQCGRERYVEKNAGGGVVSVSRGELDVIRKVGVVEAGWSSSGVSCFVKISCKRGPRWRVCCGKMIEDVEIVSHTWIHW